MSELILWGAQALLSMFEVWLCYKLLSYIIIDKDILDERDNIIIGCNICGVGLFLAFNRYIVFFSYLMFAIEVFFTVICVTWITRKNLLLILGLVMSYYSLMSLLDFFFLFMSTIFINETVLYDYYGVSLFQLPIYFISRMIMVGFIYFLKERAKILKEYIHEYRSLLLGLGMILTFVLRRYQVIRVNMISNVLLSQGIKSGLSLLLFIVIGCTFVSLLLKSLILQKENQILATKDELLSQKYQGIMCSVEKNKQIVHDMKHHLMVLSEYERTGEYEKLHVYLENLSEKFASANDFVWTGNKVLDFILNEKKAEAEQKGIKFTIYASALLKHFLNDGDICVLFGNLLDNAIEACEGVSEEPREIAIKIDKQKQLLFIEVTNNMNILPFIRRGKFITIKADKEFHGYGMKSVEHIVYKYEGTFSYYIKENIFTVNISFFNS